MTTRDSSSLPPSWSGHPGPAVWTVSAPRSTARVRPLRSSPTTVSEELSKRICREIHATTAGQHSAQDPAEPLSHNGINQLSWAPPVSLTAGNLTTSTTTADRTSWCPATSPRMGRSHGRWATSAGWQNTRRNHRHRRRRRRPLTFLDGITELSLWFPRDRGGFPMPLPARSWIP